MPFENVKAQKAHDPEVWDFDDDIEEQEEGTNELDSEENQLLLNKIEEWYETTRIIQSSNRVEQAKDSDFYDGLQWEEEDRLELERRGQAPLVFNEIKPAIDWILGTERRTRTDWNVLARRDDGVETAQVKKKLLKYIADVNRIRFHRSEAFADAVKVGIGWLEDGVQDPSFGDEVVYSRRESWRYMYYDPLAKEKDLSDARFIFRDRWTDLDIAIAMFPERKEELRRRAESHNLTPTDEDEFFNDSLYYSTDQFGSPVGKRSTVNDLVSSVHSRRSRVKLTECWYKKPCNCKVFTLNRYHIFDKDEYSDIEKLNGEEYDENNRHMNEAIEYGLGNVGDINRLKMHCAIFVEGSLLQNLPSPYRHNHFPFTPVWGFRRDRDGCAYGVVRNQRDPQEDLNKRRSKALHILSTNQVVMEEGAVDDIEELRDEVADPSGVIRRNRGFELEIRNDKSLAEEHIMLEARDGEYIRNVSGVTGENLGRDTNAKSGVAIERKQQQGSAVTAELFDNLMFAQQVSGEKQLSLAEQFFDYPHIVRITDDRGRPEFTQINYPSDDGSEIVNDITRFKADFVISETDWRESVRIAMFEQLIEMVGNMQSDIALQLLDLVFELSDLPGKDELVRRVRKINGQSDPDNQDDPDEQQRQLEQQKAQEEEAQLDRATREAELRERVAKAKSLEADATNKRVVAMEKALELVDILKLDPKLARSADVLMDSLLTEEAA